jgi:hypothetical protein
MTVYSGGEVIFIIITMECAHLCIIMKLFLVSSKEKH